MCFCFTDGSPIAHTVIVGGAVMSWRTSEFCPAHALKTPLYIRTTNARKMSMQAENVNPRAISNRSIQPIFRGFLRRPLQRQWRSACPCLPSACYCSSFMGAVWREPCRQLLEAARCRRLRVHRRTRRMQLLLVAALLDLPLQSLCPIPPIV